MNPNTTFRFAIMGAGNIANKFYDAVNRLENCCVAAVASKSMERAKNFADKYGIAGAYDSYEQMLIEEKPDCVYIATTCDSHYELSMLCLQYNTPILCEKAMFLNSTEAQEVFALAKEKQVFVMEAMWSRFLPAVNKAKEWLQTGKIGDPVYANIKVGFRAPQDPENRYFGPKLGGGAAYDLTVYCYEIMTWMLGEPSEVKASAVFGPTGVDVTDHVLLRFSGKNGAPDAMASCESSFMTNMTEGMTILGGAGRIAVPNPHYGSEAFLYDEQGNQIEAFKDEATENGFVYEAQEVVNCIRAGKIESDIVPHALTIACAKVFDLLMAEK